MMDVVFFYSVYLRVVNSVETIQKYTSKTSKFKF